MQGFLYYLPRALSAVIILFFAFFMTDSTSPVYMGQDPLVRLWLTLLVLGISIVAWRIPMMGGALLAIFGVRYLLMIFRPGNLTSSLEIFSFFLLTGLLFMIEGYRINPGGPPPSSKLWEPGSRK